MIPTHHRHHWTTARNRLATLTHLTEAQASDAVGAFALIAAAWLAALIGGVAGALVTVTTAVVWLLATRDRLAGIVWTGSDEIDVIHGKADNALNLAQMAYDKVLEWQEWMAAGDAEQPEPEPEPEPEQPATEDMPAIAPTTVPMHRAWDDSAAQLDKRVDDVLLAWSLAELEDRIWGWRHKELTA